MRCDWCLPSPTHSLAGMFVIVRTRHTERVQNTQNDKPSASSCVKQHRRGQCTHILSPAAGTASIACAPMSPLGRSTLAAARASSPGDLSACCTEMVSLAASLEPGQSKWSICPLQPSIQCQISWLRILPHCESCSSCLQFVRQPASAPRHWGGLDCPIMAVPLDVGECSIGFAACHTRSLWGAAISLHASPGCCSAQMLASPLPLLTGVLILCCRQPLRSAHAVTCLQPAAKFAVCTPFPQRIAFGMTLQLEFAGHPL